MRALKILIVDDTAANARLVETVVSRQGHSTLIAENGQQALELFESEQPDLVLMDVMMPVMDGITATKILRERLAARHRWVPIIILSALDDIADIVRGLEAGADDYIVKPVNIQLLKAKVQNFVHQVEMHEQIHQYTVELEQWRAEAEAQTELGRHIMQRLVGDNQKFQAVEQFNLPAQDFSGDLVCSAHSPDGILHLLLADATGHGLPAALCAIPIAHTFYSMTAKGFPIVSIAKEMNHKLRQFLPADRFVAVTLAAVNTEDQTIEVWNGGNPGALLIGSDGKLLKDWASLHPPLGIVSETAFSEHHEIVRYKEDCHLLICSDGLWEAESASGSRIERQRVLDIFAAGIDDRLTAMKAMIANHLDGRPAHDDISCLLAYAPVEKRDIPRVETEAMASAASYAGEWRFSVSYAAEDLKYLDIVPPLLDLMCQIEPLKAHKGSLFIVLSELYNNALDHGLLGLDSALKLSGDFEQYLTRRETCLEELKEGHIEISVHLHSLDGKPVLDLTIADSGPGFDFETHLSDETRLQQTDRPHGRGIALVKKLCEQTRYVGTGNQVFARYSL